MNIKDKTVKFLLKREKLVEKHHPQTCVRRPQFLRQMNATLGTGNSLLINNHLILLASCNLRKIKYNRST